jgi:hypothetical protein
VQTILGHRERTGVSSGSQSAFMTALWWHHPDVQYTRRLWQPWPRMWPSVTGGNVSRRRGVLMCHSSAFGGSLCTGSGSLAGLRARENPGLLVVILIAFENQIRWIDSADDAVSLSGLVEFDKHV